MISGRQTLGDVRAAFKEERDRLKELDRRLDRANDEIIAVDAARADKLAELARVRLGKPGLAAKDESEVPDERVSRLLEERRRARTELESRLQELEATTQRLEREREGLVDALEAATDELDAAEAATQKRLEQDDAYRAQRERAQAAQSTAGFAAEKAAQSEEERDEKGSAYEADPLFMYLWRRDFGTASYRGWGLTRWLDRKVARLISYDSARANYFRLQELPLRLHEHAQRMAAVAEEEIAKLRELDEAAREADGLDELERRRAEAEAALGKHDAAVAKAEDERQEAFDRLERMNRGEDEAYNQMVALLASELDRLDRQALRREALATPLPEDDVIVVRLLELEDERRRLVEAIADLKAAADGSRAKLQELQSFLRDFKEQRYDAPGTTFPDEDLVLTMLGQFIRGTATREILWRVLEGQRQTSNRRSSPTFGSGGFGRGTPWSGGGSWPQSSRGGGFRPPTSGQRRTGGGMKGGGFRTGGTMRRGGFRTGGKKR